MRKLFIVAIIFLTTQIGIAQPPPDPITGCWPPPCVPIDGGISLLLIAGATYGGKKIFDSRKNNSDLNK